MLSCELLPSGYKRFVWLLTILHLLESNSLFYFSKTWKLLKSQIEEIFIELTSSYMAEVKKCVTDNYSKISGEAQKELEEVFNENDKGPQLQDVPFGFFERIKFAVLGRLPFNFVQEVFIKQYTKSFYDKLKGSKKEHGLFAKQCIVQPAKEYSKQITEWSNGYKQSIQGNSIYFKGSKSIFKKKSGLRAAINIIRFLLNLPY